MAFRHLLDPRRRAAGTAIFRGGHPSSGIDVVAVEKGFSTTSRPPIFSQDSAKISDGGSFLVSFERLEARWRNSSEAKRTEI
jgi:hypothetical protein